MTRLRIWLALVAALLGASSTAAVRFDPDPPAASTSVTGAAVPSSTVASDCDGDAPAWAPGQGRYRHGFLRPQRQFRALSRTPLAPHPLTSHPSGVHGRSRPSPSQSSTDSASECAPFLRALRDGTLSARSTGLPPPAA